VAIAAAVMLAPALLENDDVGPAGLLFDFTDNGGTGEEGGADIHGSAIGNHENLGEIHLVAGRAVELFDEDFIIGSNTILFAASLDDCVHFIAFFIPRALWRRCKLIKQRALVPDITGFFELPEAAHGRSPGLPPKAMGGF
jgi:hypothetical protein